MKIIYNTNFQLRYFWSILCIIICIFVFYVKMSRNLCTGICLMYGTYLGFFLRFVHEAPLLALSGTKYDTRPPPKVGVTLSIFLSTLVHDMLYVNQFLYMVTFLSSIGIVTGCTQRTKTSTGWPHQSMATTRKCCIRFTGLISSYEICVCTLQ